MLSYVKCDSIKLSTPCKLYKGFLNDSGYGYLYYKGKHVLAHRLAWFLEYGKWPDPFALHRCEHRHCISVDHLYEGDRKQNALDKQRDKGITWFPSLSLTFRCGHPRTKFNSYRNGSSGGTPRFACRQCKLERKKY